MIDYHDLEWGVPVHDERHHFELLCLEGAQAGLSWRTVLNKRDAYRKAFANFEPSKVARFGDRELESLVLNAGLIRNRAKLKSVLDNARAYLALQDELGSFDDYIWSFVDGKPIINRFKRLEDLPAETEISSDLSKDLRRRGFRFVGPTICYAHMQSAGLVVDHLMSCPRWKVLGS